MLQTVSMLCQSSRQTPLKPFNLATVKEDVHPFSDETYTLYNIPEAMLGGTLLQGEYYQDYDGCTLVIYTRTPSATVYVILETVSNTRLRDGGFGDSLLWGQQFGWKQEEVEPSWPTYPLEMWSIDVVNSSTVILPQIHGSFIGTFVVVEGKKKKKKIYRNTK